MTENRIRHLPVVDSDQVTGIISIGDLVNWIITAARRDDPSFAELYRGKLYRVAASRTEIAASRSPLGVLFLGCELRVELVRRPDEEKASS